MNDARTGDFAWEGKISGRAGHFQAMGDKKIQAKGHWRSGYAFIFLQQSIAGKFFANAPRIPVGAPFTVPVSYGARLQPKSQLLRAIKSGKL